MPLASLPDRALLLRLILYYDIFRHPLTTAELAWLSGADPGPALQKLLQEGFVVQEGPYIVRPGRSDWIAERRRRAAEAERLWPQARLAGQLLARFPAVQGVLVTGSLSKRSATPQGDVDFLLLITPGHVWRTKTLLQGFRKLLPEPIRDLFCTNYLLSMDSLPLDDRNLYTAMELMTAVPLHGPKACTALLDANPWVSDHLPGYASARLRAELALPAPGAPFLDHLPGFSHPALEEANLKLWNQYWNQKYRWLPTEVRAQRFKRRPEVSTNHLHDFQAHVLREFAARMASVEAL